MSTVSEGYVFYIEIIPFHSVFLPLSEKVAFFRNHEVKESKLTTTARISTVRRGGA